MALCSHRAHRWATSCEPTSTPTSMARRSPRVLPRRASGPNRSGSNCRRRGAATISSPRAWCGERGDLVNDARAMATGTAGDPMASTGATVAPAGRRRGRPAARRATTRRPATGRPATGVPIAPSGERRPPRERPAPPSRPKAKRLRAGRKHRKEVLDALVSRAAGVAEQVLRGGVPAVRQAVDKQNEQARAEGHAGGQGRTAAWPWPSSCSPGCEPPSGSTGPRRRWPTSTSSTCATCARSSSRPTPRPATTTPAPSPVSSGRRSPAGSTRSSRRG